MAVWTVGMSRALIALAAIPALPVLAAYGWWLECQRLALEPYWDWDNQPPFGERLIEKVA